MNNRVFTIVVLFLAFTAMALTGRVVDQSGIPLTEVTVQRVSDGVMVLTGSDGSFTLKSSVPVGAQEVDRSPTRIRLRDGVLFFTTPHAGAMSLRTLDLEGNEIASSSGMPGMEGEIQYRVFGSRPHSSGVYLVQYRIGSTTGTIRVAATKQGLASGSLSGSGHSSLMRGAAVQAVDSLEFSKAGYVTRRLPLVSDSQDLGAIVLERDFGIPWRAEIAYGSVTDERDGQTYRTVVIGTQTWMAQNLNYRNTTGSVDTVGRCYNNSADSCAKYGRLYTWAEVMQGATSSALSPSGVKGLCPTGWHVPSDLEWTTLANTSGGNVVAGGHLKSTNGWQPIGASSSNGADTYGFRALPGGNVNGGSPRETGYIGYWWTATEEISTNAWRRFISYNETMVWRYYSSKTSRFSARCLED